MSFTLFSSVQNHSPSLILLEGLKFTLAQVIMVNSSGHLRSKSFE